MIGSHAEIKSSKVLNGVFQIADKAQFNQVLDNFDKIGFDDITKSIVKKDIINV